MRTVTHFALLYIVVCFLLSSCSNSKKVDQENKNFPKELTQFTRTSETPLFGGTGTDTWDKKIRERGFIIYEDGIYKMWYTGYNDDITKTRFLGYATSGDGINWERSKDNPIFTEKWVEDMCVVKDNGTYYMYAEGDNDVAHLLSSADGINWEEQGDLTILTTEGDTIPGPYGTPSVWIENGQWYLYYERNDAAIWLAKSNDMLTWKNVQDDPVIPLGPDSFDIGAMAADQIVKYQGKYYLYYHATSSVDWQHPSSPVKWSSDVAMSEDLIHWTKYSGNPIVEDNCSSPLLVFDGEKPSLYTMHPSVFRYTSK